ncbi:SDR family NAD(P)-dependent oxidoreductase [Wenzhouxiangella sp. XN201]|uniref:SDR family NAD(P)-dependent oxidoreductase n=1 Tax=Wenzhouxiangella sp. XN201 TaxID=2710755 RepID=UPI0013CC096B|nr:SDR family NAD(P)-dependent oxidoreductase [Wenzhouxiangella sp. XN201]NEZ04084.1 SDR family NAD(P)-dependent oxidoreductase [Wenzhouxiangella sp. XN201]
MDESTQKHHTALITGAASGLGEAMARRFAAGGWQVIIADRNIDVARRVAESLGEGNEAVALDVTEPEQWQALVEHVRETRGRLDLLVNNAGVAVGGSLEDTPAEDWRWVIDIDLMGVVWGCKAFAPMLREQGHGHVVNVSSFAGLAGAPQINAYGTAKAGVIAMSEMLRTELAPAGVHVSVLCPAFVRTNLTQTMRAPDGYHKRVERWMDTSGVTVEDVAETVFGAVGKRRFMLLTHGNTRWLWWIKRWFPELYHRMIMRSVRKAMRHRA